MLLNADGYSRWFNPTEFLVPKIFGYIPGKLASPGYTGSATLNPYKYFGDGLGSEDDLWTYLSSGGINVGYFLASTSNTRNYIIRFPIPMPGIKYGYAVVADWSGTAPWYHPSYAAESVGVKLADNSSVYYVDDSHKGGNLILDISVFDWDAELTVGWMEDYNVKVESTVLASSYSLNISQMMPDLGGAHWYTYHAEIPADNVTGVDGNEMWVVVEDAETDYTNPLGVPNSADGDKLAACYRFPLTVLNEEPLWITVVDPNGGNQWKVGDSAEIKWEAHPDIQNVAIGLSLNSGGNYTQLISASTPNDGSFMWDPIPTEALGNYNRIKIMDVDNPTVYDESDADFAVVQLSITVMIPKGGEVWKVGDSQDITWTASPGITNVKIELSLDSGASYPQVIAASTPNDGTFTWNPIPPEAASDHCRIRISDAANGAVNDTSNADFSVHLPTIHVSSPNGGEVWVADTTQQIQWTSQSVTGDVKIEYFSGWIWKSVIDDTANDGSHDWLIPHESTTQARVKVTSVSSPGVFDTSDADFTINTPYFQVVAPNGGENWAAGSAQIIEWISQSVTGGVKIEYYNGSTWKSVIDDMPNIGFYEWHIPDDPTTLALVKISSVLSPGVFDISNNVFTISLSGWARTWGSSSYDIGYGVAVDGSGNTYVAGLFNGTDVDFDPGSGVDNHSSNGAYDIFLSKFDSSGSFLWARTWGGSSYDSGLGVAVDKYADVYVTGNFDGTVDFDPGGGVDSHDGGGAFLSKFGPSGSFLWARTWGYSVGNGVAADKLANVYVTGYFGGTDVDFNPGSGVDNHSSNGDWDIFLSYFDSSGNFQWADTWGGSGEDRGNRIAVDAYNNAYVTGDFIGTVDFDPGSGFANGTSNGGKDIFLSKIDSTGSYVMANTWGGSGTDTGFGVAVDVWGKGYVTGYFSDTVDFGGDNHTSIGDSDVFLSKFSEGLLFMWTRTWGGSYSDEGKGVAADVLGNVYVSGGFWDEVDFDPGGGFDYHTSLCDYDVFLSQFDSDGYFNWARTWSGTYIDYSNGVAADGSGNAYVTGYFGDTMDFDPGSGVDSHTSNGLYDVFLSKFLPDGNW
jgi:hypothetical protein